jgi:hypothetical protein
MRLIATLLLASGLTFPALAYDDTWYRANGWSGEYPDGFTMTADAVVSARATPDPDAQATISCALKKGATYHQWNETRVKADGLDFVTFSRIVPYATTQKLTADVTRDRDGTALKLKLAKGARWDYLIYGSEGFFLMRYKGVAYQAGQDLAEKSRALDTAANEAKPDEWLALPCANGDRGWILFADLAGNDAFGSPNITEYGQAADAPAP